jgi:hypothetical protein
MPHNISEMGLKWTFNLYAHFCRIINMQILQDDEQLKIISIVFFLHF